MHDFMTLPVRYFLVGVFDRHSMWPLLCRGVVDSMCSIPVVFNNYRLQGSCKMNMFKISKGKIIGQVEFSTVNLQYNSVHSW